MTCKLVSVVWGALSFTVNVLYGQVDLSARGPTPVYLKRKTNLYFVERAYCSQGVVVANFLGSLADSEEGIEVRMLITDLHRHQQSNLRELIRK